MVEVLRTFSTWSEDEQEVMLCECRFTSDGTTMRNDKYRSTNESTYFKTGEGDVAVTIIEIGVYKLRNGTIVREAKNSN